MNENFFFVNIFPEAPVMPGVIIVEANGTNGRY
jgi:3-hydroxymyristoyl/3-hydroxydecanoyl-(acyl carrier protein) dehydratase